MPGVSSSLPPPSKKQKTSKPSKIEGGSRTESQRIAELEKSISDALTSNGSLNALADLSQIAYSTEDDDALIKAIFALYRSFTLISQKGILTTVKKSNDAEDEERRRTVRSWTLARLDAFTNILGNLLQDNNKMIRQSSLRIFFSLLRQLSSAMGGDEEMNPLQFDVPYFQKIVHAVLLCPLGISGRKPHGTLYGKRHLETQSNVRDLLLDAWLNQYVDIRWFFLRETATLLEDVDVVRSHPLLPANVLSILEKLTGMPASSSPPFKSEQFWIEGLQKRPKLKKERGSGEIAERKEGEDDEDEDDWRKFFDDPKPVNQKGKSRASRVHMLSVHAQLHNISAHRAVFTRCWLVLLPLLSSGGEVFEAGFDEDLDHAEQSRLLLVSRALVVLHHGVLPHLTRPVLIMDWVASCVDYGGYVGMLALNALFVLIHEYNLDYPSFYKRLYAFFTRDVLHLRYRARFFRLIELFLSSTHLPAALLASFIKRMARLSLFAPPAGIIIVIPFTYNILKRHPALMCMIHRPDVVEDTDSFDPEESDPMQTKALQSSLWELATQRQHYHAPIATLARMFEDAFTRPGFAMEDFLDHTYATLFETEVRRRIRKEPPVLDSDLAMPIVLDALALADDAGDEAVVVPTDIVSTLWGFR